MNQNARKWHFIWDSLQGWRSAACRLSAAYLAIHEESFY